jgi:ABC-type multidrug transport system fused ATPase/permease subunit
LQKKRAFLENELRESRVVDMQKSIYRLIEAQMAVSMLANAKEEFILEVLDPAILPLDTYSASNKSFFFIGSISGALFSIFLIFSKILLNSIKQTLAQHNEIMVSKKTAQMLGDKQ